MMKNTRFIEKVMRKTEYEDFCIASRMNYHLKNTVHGWFIYNSKIGMTI